MAQITRRDFLKFGFTSAAVAGFGSSLAGCFSPPPEVPHKVPRTAAKPVSVASTCVLCPAGCGIVGEVLDGRLVKIMGNPKHPNNRGKICSRGYAGVNVLYDPDRLLYPLKRAGSRGQGKWTRISWDQAWEEMASRMGAMKKGGKTESLWVELEGPESKELCALGFLKAFGSPSIFVESDHPSHNGELGRMLTWGAGFPVSDAAQSRFILNFGANPYENHEQYIFLAQRIVEGRMAKSAKLVTFDVRLSNTAGKSNEWIPIQPGTDGMVALALAQHIIQQGLHDKEFLTRWTNYPLPKLVEHLSQYTPEQAEKVSGVKATDIRRLANEFAQAKPATIITGRGVGGHQNGTLNERCIALLGAVVGNIDIPGGCCLPRKMELEEPQWKSPYTSSAQAIAALKEGKAQPEMYFCYLANPAYANPDTEEVTRILKDEKRVPFLVVADTHLTETGTLADLILPMASYLESWNLESRPAMELVPFVSIRQPMVTPLGKSMSLGDAFIGLGRRMGEDLGKAFPYRGSEEFVAQAGERIEGLAKAGGFELLKKEGVWFDPAARPNYRSFEKKGFPTASGKLEIFSAKLQERGFPPLPVYVPIQSHEGRRESELILAVNRANVMTLRLANSKWLGEILHTNPLWMNLRTGESLGLRNGDRVKVTSKSGSVTVPVRLINGLHPQVVALTEGLGHWGLGNVAGARKVKTSDFDTDLLWWENEGNGVDTNRIVSANFDPVAGGVAWNDTVVTVTRI
ncbi:MAG TPA: molybdopterin-dependent oxidoreductase [Thermodesulfobacteriota bacterium]|nr:molybdopterin-dependent oxidoreductase [Thermodesulfobacteriota bacterium]